MERENRQIVLVWFCILAAVFLVFVGRSAVNRARYSSQGQRIWVEVAAAADASRGEYSVFHTDPAGTMTSYIMPSHNMFIRHSFQGQLEVLALPDSDFVQPASTLEYWLSRTEIKWSWILIVLATISFWPIKPEEKGTNEQF